MTKLHARYMYLFHWHCNYFHFLITAVARLYTCTCTLLHSMNTYKETENSSSWGTQFMYYFVSSICSYSKMMTSNLSWCHKINMSTSVCFMYMNFSNTKKSDYSYSANEKARTMTPVQGEGGEGSLIQQSQGCAKAFSILWLLKSGS